MPGMHLKSEIPPDEFLSHLTEATYRAALVSRTKGSFVDLHLDLLRSVQDVIRRDMFVSDECGLHAVCDEASHFEPWSREAQKAYEGG